MMCERINLSDWEGEEQVGGNIYGSVIWAETALLLTARKFPAYMYNVMGPHRRVRPRGGGMAD